MGSKQKDFFSTAGALVSHNNLRGIHSIPLHPVQLLLRNLNVEFHHRWELTTLSSYFYRLELCKLNATFGKLVIILCGAM